MIGLLKKSSFFYISHIFTFSMMGWSAVFESRYGVFIVMASLVPVWMSSSVLFSEKSEQYRFLRVLPITSKEVVGTKLSLIMAAGSAYLALMTFIILLAGERGGHLPVNFATIICSCVLSVLLAFGWQICIWRFGISKMTPAILFSATLMILLVIVTLSTYTRRPNLIGVNDIPVFRLLSQPFWFIPVLALAGLSLFGLWHLAIRVFEQNDPD